MPGLFASDTVMRTVSPALAILPETDRSDILSSFSASPQTEQIRSQVLSARFSVHSPKTCPFASP